MSFDGNVLRTVGAAWPARDYAIAINAASVQCTKMWRALTACLALPEVSKVVPLWVVLYSFVIGKPSQTPRRTTLESPQLGVEYEGSESEDVLD